MGLYKPPLRKTARYDYFDSEEIGDDMLEFSYGNFLMVEGRDYGEFKYLVKRFLETGIRYGS